MTKREKVLTSITSVSLAIALPRHPCYATTLRGTRAASIHFIISRKILWLFHATLM